MISRLEIKGFKSFVDTAVDLGVMNVFIGANGSGKSNLLEAFGILGAITSGGLEAEAFRYRGVRLGSPSTYRSSLIDQQRQSIFLAASDESVRYVVRFGPDEAQTSKWIINYESVDFESAEMLTRTESEMIIHVHENKYRSPIDANCRSRSLIPSAPWYLGWSVGKSQPEGEDKNIPAHTRVFLNRLSSYAIYSPSTPQLRSFLDDIQREPLGLGGSGLGQAIDEMMKASPGMLGPFDMEDVYELIDWADSLDTDSGDSDGSGVPIRIRIGDRFMEVPHKSVSLLEASEGALYVLFMLALVGHEQSPKFFAVDNFDQALHPRLACALTRLISDQILEDGSRQMLATTHNPLVLDGLDLLDDRVRLFTVDRDENGASRVERVLVTEELIDQGFSLSRLWTSGRLGGVPRNL